MDTHIKNLLLATPKMRSIENKDEKDRIFQDDMIDAYIRKYVNLTKQMAHDYKRYAINAFLTEMYCDTKENPKYPAKHKELIERALYGDQGWYKLKDKLLKVNDLNLDNLDMALPYSIKKAARELHDHFSNVLQVQDIDERTLTKIQDQSAEFEDDEEEEEVDVDYSKLPSEKSAKKDLDEFAKEVDQVSFRQLKKKIILERADSRNSMRSRMSRQNGEAEQADKQYMDRSFQKT